MLTGKRIFLVISGGKDQIADRLAGPIADHLRVIS